MCGKGTAVLLEIYLLDILNAIDCTQKKKKKPVHPFSWTCKNILLYGLANIGLSDKTLGWFQ